MHYINGLWKNSGTHRFAASNPATGQEMWHGFAAGQPEVAEAVAAARAAFPAWAARPFAERLEICRAFHAYIEPRRNELATLIAQETGKALWDSVGEVAAVQGKLVNAEAAYHERTGTHAKDALGGQAVLRHKPHGVLAIFAPYNFPAHLANGHIIPALLAGNTLVLKPSELTPVVPEWMVRAWEAAGLPKGVLNLVQGEKDTGIALANAPIDGLLFTGSTATGKALHAQFAGRPEIIVALEMGGNNPLIVHEVADIDAAVLETMLSAFTGTGQRCTCARRLIVTDWKQSPVFIDRLVASARQLNIGGYDETPAPFMGPLITNREVDRILAQQEALEKQGAKILLKAQRLRGALPFISPAIIDVTAVKNRLDEEFFGPMLQIIRVNSMEEAVLEANNTKYGLSAAIFADDRAIFDQYAPKMHAGLLNWNRQTTGASGAAPFGGVGCSGNHRPAGYYAADYCAYPAASVEIPALKLPEKLPDGVTL
jgi:succinylglutamic semialdehyde dehydrogenase